jgi:PKD repeat protein
MKAWVQARVFFVVVLLLAVTGVSQVQGNDGLPGHGVPPVAMFTYAIEGATVSFNASGSVAGDAPIVNYTWRFGDGATGYGMTTAHTYGQEGTYRVTLAVTDDDGRSNESTASIMVDLAAPTTTLTSAPARPNGQHGWWVTAVTITLAAKDDMSGVNATYYTINYATQQEYTGPFSLTGSGTYNVSYYSIDNAGNRESRHSRTFRIDRHAPTSSYMIDGAAPTETGWYTSGVDLSLSASDDREGSGVDATMYRIIGKNRSFQQYGEPLNLTAEDTHVIQYYSRDVAGNAERLRNVTVPIDRTKPSISIDVPRTSYLYINGREMLPLSMVNKAAVVIGSLTVQATAYDATAGVRNVSFSVDGEFRSIDNRTPYTWEWNENTAGAATLRVTAEDAAGHTASAEVSVVAFIRR